MDEVAKDLQAMIEVCCELEEQAADLQKIIETCDASKEDSQAIIDISHELETHVVTLKEIIIKRMPPKFEVNEKVIYQSTPECSSRRRDPVQIIGRTLTKHQGWWYHALGNSVECQSPEKNFQKLENKNV